MHVNSAACGVHCTASGVLASGCSNLHCWMLPSYALSLQLAFSVYRKTTVGSVSCVLWSVLESNPELLLLREDLKGVEQVGGSEACIFGVL
jgi:hypothetical protein